MRLTDAEFVRLQGIAAQLPPDDAKWLQARLIPSERRQARAEAILTAAEAWAPVGSARSRAQRLLQALSIYAEQHWRHDRPTPLNPRMGALYQVIAVYHGKVPGLRTIEGVLATFAKTSIRKDEAA